MRIFKQVLDITDKKTYSFPGYIVKPLCVKNQDGNFVLYYMTDADINNNEYNLHRDYTVYIVGTGHERTDVMGCDYLGTEVMPNGLVWHCFIREE